MDSTAEIAKVPERTPVTYDIGASDESAAPRPIGRNHWKRLSPDEFVAYPKYEPLSYYQESTLIRRAQQGDLAARNEVWERNARLVLSVANQFSIPLDLMPDAIQEGMLGILRAIEKFDVDRCNTFSTHAWIWIRQRIHRFLSTHRHAIPVPAHLWSDYSRFRRDLTRCPGPREWTHCLELWNRREPRRIHTLLRIHRLISAMRLAEVKLPIPIHCPADSVAQEIDHEYVRREVRSRLNDRDYRVISLRYGLDGTSGATLEEIGTQMGVTRERVRQIQTRAEKRLARQLKSLNGLPGSPTMSPGEIDHKDKTSGSEG